MKAPKYIELGRVYKKEEEFSIALSKNLSLLEIGKLEDMKKLVDAMVPEMVLPIHSFHPDKFKDYFPSVRLVDDGEVVNL